MFIVVSFYYLTCIIDWNNDGSWDFHFCAHGMWNSKVFKKEVLKLLFCNLPLCPFVARKTEMEMGILLLEGIFSESVLSIV